MSNARYSVPRLCMIGLGLIALAAVAFPARGQEQDQSTPKSGVVTDWSSNHVVFSNPGTQQQAQQRGQYDTWLKIVNDPRYIMQQQRRNSPGQSGGWPFGRGGNGGPGNHGWRGNGNPSIHKDWSMSVGAQTFSTLTLTVSGSATAGNSASQLEIGTVTLNASAPTSGTQTGRFSALPTSTTASAGSITVANTNPSNTLTMTSNATQPYYTGTFSGALTSAITITVGTTTTTITPTGIGSITVGGQVTSTRTLTVGSITYEFEQTSCTGITNCIYVPTNSATGGNCVTPTACTTAQWAGNILAALADSTADCTSQGTGLGCFGTISGANTAVTPTLSGSVVTLTAAAAVALSTTSTTNLTLSPTTGGILAPATACTGTSGTIAYSTTLATEQSELATALGDCTGTGFYAAAGGTDAVKVTDQTFGYDSNTFSTSANVSGVITWVLTLGTNGSDACTSPTSGTFELNTSGVVPTTTTEATNFANEVTACNTSNNNVGVSATNATSRVTVTADNPGSAPGVTLGSTFSNFTWTADDFTNGSDGADAANSFKYYTTSGTLDTAAQLAQDLDTAIGDTTSLASVVSATYTPGETTILLTNETTGSVAVTPTTFSNLTGTGTLAASVLSTVRPNTYPALFSAKFSTTTPSCSDYIVYPTGLAGATSQATIIAYTKLYKTTCASTPPTIDYAYNTGTGATVGLSPVISGDGTQIAFVQILSGVASLVILRPVAGQGTSISAPASPGQTFTCTSTTGSCGTQAGDYVTCKTGATSCALVLQFVGSTAPNDSNSSPFYTYGSTGISDTIFVGDNSGKLHEFTYVFTGTPAENTTNWPVTVYNNGTTETITNSTNPSWLTDPVYDSGTSGLVYVNDGAGYLHSVNRSTLAVATSNQMECGSAGFADAPVVDSSAEQVYVFVGDGCSDGTSPVFSSYVNRFVAGAVSGYGANSAEFGNQANNTVNTVQYDGDFDNAYYSGTYPAGNLYACVDGALFQIPLSTFGATTTQVPLGDVTFSTPVSAVSDAATCSPLTEFSNSSADDYLFVSVQANGEADGCTGACIFNYNIYNAGPTGTVLDELNAAGGTSGIVIDNKGLATGESQIYYGTLANQACNGVNGTGTNGYAASASCAVQTSQATP
ncbi:MAG: hypothetical protein WBX09_21250 [Terracidiphilus sp.]